MKVYHVPCLEDNYSYLDHAGGNEKIKELLPGIKVYGGSLDNVKGCTGKLENGDNITLGAHLNILSLHTPSGEAPAPKPVQTNVQAAPSEAPAVNNSPAPKPAAASPPVDVTKQIPAGIHSTSTNNYMRADGQNTGNFITDRPSTKVHSAPGGGSSLGYLFGGGPAGGGGN
ncbi:protein spiral1-like 1 [Quercus suber]|uniref:Protein spiral1-like 1 n=1 Tax=Quercus suber TaxID=58331 RepID=A0AAW0LQQ3_QUESU